jgi:hypothetical protein
MPAKKEYLSSGWKRFSKLAAAIFGAYMATMMVHMAIAKNVPNDLPVLLTATYSAFFVWVGLMIMVYLIPKAWISWAILVLVSVLSAALIFV